MIAFQVDLQYSSAITDTPLKFAIKTKNMKAAEVLMKEMFGDRNKKSKERVKQAASFISTADTGR